MSKNENKFIYHFTTESWWAKWKDQNYFETENLQQEGFIHCCTKDQIKLVYQNYFLGAKDILLLLIDASLLNSELKYELSTDNQYFPHIYGSVNRNAIVNVILPGEFINVQN
jgi:uncharacterized protein (DUF952 family)